MWPTHLLKKFLVFTQRLNASHSNPKLSSQTVVHGKYCLATNLWKKKAIAEYVDEQYI